MTDARGVCAGRAETLIPDVPYVRGWAHAKRKADALAEELLALGLDFDFPGLAPDVNVFGDGIVSLGPVRPEAAEILAQLITAGLAAEMGQGQSEQDQPDSPAG
jgi:hypothetical protein